MALNLENYVPIGGTGPTGSAGSTGVTGATGATGTVGSIDDLTDVDTSGTQAPVPGDVLSWDGVNWSPAAAVTPSLSTVLATGNTTGANDVIVSAGQVVRGVDAATGTALTLRAGTSSGAFIAGPTTAISGGAGSPTGDGGTLSLTGGAGGTDINQTQSGGLVSITGGLGGFGPGGGVTITGGFGQDADGGAITVTGGDSFQNAGGNVSIIGGPGPDGGGNLTLRGGNSSAAFGGAVSILGGTPTDGVGGAVTITGANGVGTNRAGGAVTIICGAAVGNANGGAFALTAGSGGSTGTGGDVTLTSGAGGSISGQCGIFSILGANAGSAGEAGGDVDIQAGQGGTTGAGGNASLYGGNAAGTSGVGGLARIEAGTGAGASAGGNAILVAGNGGVSGNGGDVWIQAGTGGALDGEIDFYTGGLSRWSFNSEGDFIANTDNVYDIGLDGGTSPAINRPRKVFVGTEIVVGNTVTIGTNYINMDGIATIGVDAAASLGQGLTVQDGIGTTGCLMYSDINMYAFATGTVAGERSGMRLDASQIQLEFYYNNARIIYMNGNGTNFQTRRIDNFRINTGNYTTDATLGQQDTGALLTNIGASGLVTLTLPSAPSEGMNYIIYRVENFALRVQPTPAESNAIIIAAGKQADDNYIELGAVGSCVELIANTSGDWMAVYENGIITPE